MGKKYLILVLVLVVLGLIGGGYYWQSLAPKPAPLPTENSSPSATPVVDTGPTTATESTTSANPYEKTNPFSDIKVNPFE